jgi:glycosyltransferase involved in cell wall biosynthesis
MPANTAVVCSGLKNSCGGILVVQPYLFAKGHFRKYFENLLSENYNYIYCNDRDNHYLKSLWVKSLNIDNEKNFLNFVFSRLFNSLKINYFIWKKSDTTLLKIHFIEFEPFSFMAYELLTFYRKKKILITIHSIKRMRYKNRFKDLISAFQRMIYYRAVSHANKKGYRFIVHYETHKEQLLKIIKTANIEVIDYPCPYPLSEKPLTKGKGNLLIFGQIREDKGIYDFLKDKKSARLSITIAGRIEDTRILSLNRQNMNIVNKYLTEAELSNIINDHDFVIFPYDRHYTGGAGTLKDSFSYGKPVICSDIPVFKEIVNAYNTGFIYSDIEDIASFVRSIDDQQYNEMSNNCLTYAKNHNWNTMRESYFRLYDSI